MGCDLIFSLQVQVHLLTKNHIGPTWYRQNITNIIDTVHVIYQQNKHTNTHTNYRVT